MRTSNIEYRISNIEAKPNSLWHLLRCSMLSVQCSMFVFLYFGFILAIPLLAGCATQNNAALDNRDGPKNLASQRDDAQHPVSTAADSQTGYMTPGYWYRLELLIKYGLQ